MRRCGAAFARAAGAFLAELRRQSAKDFHSHMGNLATRLDYNGFYTRQAAAAAAAAAAEGGQGGGGGGGF